MKLFYNEFDVLQLIKILFQTIKLGFNIWSFNLNLGIQIWGINFYEINNSSISV